MARQFRLWENAQVVCLLPPAADAAGRTSSYISLKYGHKCFLVCDANITAGGGAVTFTPFQSSDIAGTNAVALTNPAPIANIDDTSTATGTDLFTVTTDGTRTGPVQYGTSFTTSATIKNKLVVFEIDPIESMNLNSTTLTSPGGALTEQSHIQIRTTSASANNITSCFAIIMPLRDARQNPPTTYV